MMKILLKLNPPNFNSVKLEQAQNKLQKLPVALMQVGSVLLQEIQQNLSGKILHKRTGNLYNCMNFQLAVAEYGWRLSVGSTGAVAYDWIQEMGGFAGRNKTTWIPKRSYLVQAYKDKKETVDKILQKFIREIFKP